MEDYDRSLIQSPEYNLGLSKTSTCMTLWLRSIDGYALITKIEDEKDEYLRHLANYADMERLASVNAIMRESKVKLPIDVYDQLIMLNDQQEYCPTQKLMALATTINRLHQKANNSSRLAQDLSPKGRPSSSSESSPSSSSSNSSMRSVVFDAAGALITSFSNVDERVKDMKIEKEEWTSPASEREEFSTSRRVVLVRDEREIYNFKRNLFAPDDDYLSSEESIQEKEANPEDFIDRKAIEELEGFMDEQAGEFEDDLLEKIGVAFDFASNFSVHNKAIYKRGDKTVTLHRSNSTVMLQPHDSRFGSIRQCTLKNMCVFMEAVVRLMTNPGLVSLFTEPVNRKQGEKEKVEIPRRLTWAERERELGEENCSHDRPLKRARDEEKSSAKTQVLEEQRQKLREGQNQRETPQK